MTAKDRLIVALDVDTEERALEAVEKLKASVKFFKVGFELFSSYGPSIVGKIRKTGCEVFLDLKFHDIPNTVAKAAASVTGLGVYMFNCHALGGHEMMKAALLATEETARKLKIARPKVLAVTILTSMDENALKKIGIDDNIGAEVLKLAVSAKEAGLNGVVASSVEARAIRKRLGKDFLIVTPGVRPADTSTQDQKRTATPKEAIEAGADFIVVGRPIMDAKDPAKSAQAILKEIGAG